VLILTSKRNQENVLVVIQKILIKVQNVSVIVGKGENAFFKKPSTPREIKIRIEG
jgi:hypothetical protein